MAGPERAFPRTRSVIFDAVATFFHSACCIGKRFTGRQNRPIGFIRAPTAGFANRASGTYKKSAGPEFTWHLQCRTFGMQKSLALEISTIDQV
jgi:hypothetical protein